SRLVREAIVLLSFVAIAPRAVAATRFLERDPRPAWAEFARRMVDSPRNQSLRAKLESEYASAGYLAAARLVAEGSGKDAPMRVAEQSDAGTWRCSDNPSQIAEVRRVAGSIQALVQAGNYTGAREAAEASMKKFGQACPLLAEWSESVLYSAMSA